jgi:hypothetical protein
MVTIRARGGMNDIPFLKIITGLWYLADFADKLGEMKS